MENPCYILIKADFEIIFKQVPSQKQNRIKNVKSLAIPI